MTRSQAAKLGSSTKTSESPVKVSSASEAGKLSTLCKSVKTVKTSLVSTPSVSAPISSVTVSSSSSPSLASPNQACSKGDKTLDVSTVPLPAKPAESALHQVDMSEIQIPPPIKTEDVPLPPGSPKVLASD